MVVVPIPEYETQNAKGKEYWNISMGVRMKDKERLKPINEAIARNTQVQAFLQQDITERADVVDSLQQLAQVLD